MTERGVSSHMDDRYTSAVNAGGEYGTIYSKKENAVTGVQTGETIPVELSLSQNFPNPFSAKGGSLPAGWHGASGGNPSTTIKFSIPVNGSYKFKIYNYFGEQVSQLLNGEMDPGYHELPFDASHLSSGVYLYSPVGNNVNITRKMILMK